MLQALDTRPHRMSTSAPTSASLLLLLSPENAPASASASGAALPKLSIPRPESGVVTGSHQWPAFQTSAPDTRAKSWHASRLAAPEPKTATTSLFQSSADAKRLPENTTAVGPETRSPSSPSSFFKSETITKFGLNELLEAAEQVRPESTSAEAGHPARHAVTISSPLKRDFSESQGLSQPLPSLMHSMGGYPLEAPSVSAAQVPKRVRLGSDVGMDMQASYQLLGSLPRQSMVYPNMPRQPQAPAPQELERHFQQQQVVWNPPVSTRSHNVLSPGSISPTVRRGSPTLSGARADVPSVWDAVLSTGKFPSDVGLSEHSSSSSSMAATSQLAEQSDAAVQEIKQGRWSADEEEYAQALIQAVRNGEVALPPNVSVRKFIADSLQCKAMRVSKKFHSLGQSPRDVQEQRGAAVAATEPPRTRETFNPLSLKSIMNSDASEVSEVAETMANTQLIRQSPTAAGASASASASASAKKASQRVLKRSDYSQHGMVRSGRWSVEEEQYAKAMIEAFKAGYLPLHGNVSLRKFLSEVLVCHPMRISKKFVGYVRKYHWYRIAAGKCDPEAKRQALLRLSHLERVFWTSLHQNSEWSVSMSG